MLPREGSWEPESRRASALHYLAALLDATPSEFMFIGSWKIV